RRNNREVVQASRVINAYITLHIHDQRGQHVNHRSAEQMEVHFFPSPAASQPQQHEPEHNEAVLRVGDNVEIVIVLGDIRRRVKPGHHKKDVNERPPGQQQAEVQVSEPDIAQYNHNFNVITD